MIAGRHKANIMNELARFAAKWSHPNDPPTAVSKKELEVAENTLKLRFPIDYRDQVLEAGLPSPTRALLSAIVDNDLELNDLSDLYEPDVIVTETRDWRKIGMPKTLVAMGSDGAGNKFCFDERDLQGAVAARAPVYFWDHDFNETEMIAESFAGWISSYLGDWSDDVTASDF